MKATTLGQRVKALEARLAVLEKQRSGGKRSWWRHAGWAKDDPLYEEAMRLGAEWRCQAK